MTQYKVKVKPGCIHNEDDGPGSVIVVDESSYFAFEDKFELIEPIEKVEKSDEESVPEPLPEPLPDVVAKVCDELGIDASALSTIEDEKILSVSGIGPAKLEEVHEWVLSQE